MNLATTALARLFSARMADLNILVSGALERECNYVDGLCPSCTDKYHSFVRSIQNNRSAVTEMKSILSELKNIEREAIRVCDDEFIPSEIHIPQHITEVIERLSKVTIGEKQ